MWSPSRLLRLFADVVCPERCAACEAIVPADRLFCRPCRARVRWLRDRGPTGSGVRHARSCASYRDPDGPSPVARAVVAFKYGGAQRLGPRLAAALLPRVPDPAIDLVVPVPLHPRRLRRRGYNQSAVLARHLARLLGRPVGPTVVVRTRDTPSQTALALDARTRNVAGAFLVRRPADVLGRSILLVDDVWTSGATVRAVATTLCEAGAATVDVVTIARVL